MVDNNLSERVVTVERDMLHLKEAVSEIAANTSEIREFMQQLVRLDEKHINLNAALGRCFKEMRGVEERVTSIEGEMPTLKLVRAWVLSFVLWAASVSGGLAWLIAVEVTKNAK